MTRLEIGMYVCQTGFVYLTIRYGYGLYNTIYRLTKMNNEAVVIF